MSMDDSIHIEAASYGDAVHQAADQLGLTTAERERLAAPFNTY